MPRLFAKILLFLAVLLSPLGMTAAPAVAGHSSAAEMPKGHCGDGGDHQKQLPGIADCAMACAAALPAFEAVAPAVLPAARISHVPTAAKRLPSLPPQMTTPPPKFA